MNNDEKVWKSAAADYVKTQKESHLNFEPLLG